MVSGQPAKHIKSRHIVLLNKSLQFLFVRRSIAETPHHLEIAAPVFRERFPASLHRCRVTHQYHLASECI